MKTELMLDSGAFSAWMAKEPISVRKYGEYALQHLDCFEYIVNLDVIPGQYGKVPTEQEFELSATEGWRNYKRLLAMGIPREKLLPVFHQHERMYWLERLMGETDYIGLSPANDKSTVSKGVYLDFCMELVCDENGIPKIRTHGFGVTSLPAMLRYPWWSVDSASWVIYSRYGIILVPKIKDGKYIYDQHPWKVFVSSVSPHKKDVGKHFESFSKADQTNIINYLSSIDLQMGESKLIHERSLDDIPFGPTTLLDLGEMEEIVIEEGVSNNHLLRDETNLIYYLEFSKTIPDYPRPWDRSVTMGGPSPPSII